ncbi:transcription elongation factor GreA [Mycoplasmopsis synoviae]|uniref:Transcription elongation factor GreA n=2 Tax=Mycoplasmopsis synoviae TaxID=2109 RepID=Q4A630_MYCS5|nr:transcription elongation factor GreA [Mycoplasmopsis synoviae]AAZ43791.1 transcription elongation factor GreA [Mycoplasmopsis synoviae 53]AKB11117.1 transcription elongation factor GreA [Mycoplasmopsis synoviae ATCC 25204]MBD5788679.1 transcription elongation factor GreA [Mycoplasmopsis synoviae GX11-T]QGL44986.1 transcription elongation factor GreA [Mycoplasmopsis synoviae]QXV99199.1 transcription elongation factor GreA [Mycoplasmopsis synoviae]
MEQEKIFLSQETLDKYKKEYEKLVKVDRVEIQNALKEARAQGDLSENAEYDVARDKQAVVEARILELEGILDKAQLIKHKDENTISIGSKVTFLDLSTNKEDEVTIMGIHDADPFNKKISNYSPLATAMMSKKEGDTVEVEGLEKYEIKIISVHNRD